MIYVTLSVNTNILVSFRVGHPTITSTLNIDHDTGGSRSADNVRCVQHILGKAKARWHRWPSVEAQQSLQGKRYGASTDPGMETFTLDRYPPACRTMVPHTTFDLDASGSLTCWVYRDITSDSFRWCNERSMDQGKTWRLTQEMRASRIR